MKRFIIFAMAAVAVAPLPAVATDWVITAKVTAVEVTYAPNVIDFTVDQPAGSCPASNLLWWTAQGADQATKIGNYNAIAAALLTARSTGQRVTIFGNNNGCAVINMYIVP